MDRKKIIIIDDEAQLVRSVKVYFEMHDYVCLTASNGVEGLEKIEAEKPALAILDVHMPMMDGYSMIQELKSRNIQIKCIVLTAKSRLKDLFDLEGAAHFLVKPFELAELKKVVDDLLGESV